MEGRALFRPKFWDDTEVVPPEKNATVADRRYS